MKYRYIYEIKLLGCRITNKMSFKPHALAIAGKVSEKFENFELVKKTSEARKFFFFLEGNIPNIPFKFV